MSAECVDTCAHTCAAYVPSGLGCGFEEFRASPDAWAHKTWAASVDLYNESGRPRDAVPILERIIASYGTRRTKDLAQWQHRLGRALDGLGDTAAALAQYDAAFKIDLTSVPILRDLGLSRLRVLTNHPRRAMPGLHGFGLEIVEQVALRP